MSHLSDLDKSELAFRYVRGTMEDAEKLLVFDLILQDTAFKQILKSELELLKTMNHFHEKLDAEKKKAWLNKIKDRARQIETKNENEIDWLDIVMQWMAPVIPLPVHNILKRRG